MGKFHRRVFLILIALSLKAETHKTLVLHVLASVYQMSGSVHLVTDK